jgi:hypothetical protein
MKLLVGAGAILTPTILEIVSVSDKFTPKQKAEVLELAAMQAQVFLRAPEPVSKVPSFAPDA